MEINSLNALAKVDKVDLTFGGGIPSEHVALWNALAEQIANEFNQVVATAGELEQGSLDWWVTSVASRNTSTSPLFHHCLVIAYLNQLSSLKRLPSAVICHSKATRLWLKQAYPSIKVVYSHRQQRWSFLQKLKECVGGVVHLFAQYFFAKVYRLGARAKNTLPPKVKLIDTFVTPGLMAEERYYPSLLDGLEAREKGNIFWVPFLFNHKPMNYGRVFAGLRRSEKQYLQVHSFLSFKDYCFALLHMYRRRGLKLGPALFRGVDMKPWIVEELSAYSGIKTSMMSMLFFPFFRKLKKSGVEVTVAINWFENQVVDKAWNYSVNKVFHQVKSKGYQGFYPLSMDHNLYPTASEVEHTVIPKEIWVIGSALVNDLKCFTDEIDVKVGPALRFGKPLDHNREKAVANKHRVLVALPNFLSLLQEILDNVISLKQFIGQSDKIEWIIKPHPLTSEKVLSSYKSKLSDCQWSKSDFIAELVASDLVISGRSDTCMTTILHLKPLVVIGNSSGLNHIPIPKSLDKGRWALSANKEELKHIFSGFLKGDFGLEKYTDEENRKLITDYYTPLDKSTVDKLLN